ncbi:double zinc ribbon domain-containing protein [Micromonospora zhanjiangensis]
MAASCAQCGRTAAADDRFCGGCGSELSTPCTHCSRPLPTDAAFCTACGRPQQRTPGRSVPCTRTVGGSASCSST